MYYIMLAGVVVLIVVLLFMWSKRRTRLKDKIMSVSLAMESNDFMINGIYADKILESLSHRLKAWGADVWAAKEDFDKLPPSNYWPLSIHVQVKRKYTVYGLACTITCRDYKSKTVTHWYYENENKDSIVNDITKKLTKKIWRICHNNNPDLKLSTTQKDETPVWYGI